MFQFLNKKTNNEVDFTQEKSGKVLSILNQKGGVGKTTMAFNLARALSEAGQKVLCLDMDPQSNMTLLFDVDPEAIKVNIHQMLINSIKELRPLHKPVLLADAIQSFNDPKMPDLLASGQELSGFELTVAGINSPRQLVLKKLLKNSGLLDMYDVVVVDGPPTLGLLMVNILCASDGVIVPFQADQFSQMGLKHFHQVIEDVEDMGITNGPKILGYIPNMFDNRRKNTGEEFDKILETLKANNADAPRMFRPFANKVQLVKSSAQKKSVFDFGTQDFRELQEQFADMAGHIQQEFNS